MTAATSRLNRSKVLQAAVELADGEGLDAVNMRHLAAQLGVVPMALYKHVADKEDLLDGMVDVVIAELAHPQVDASSPDWRAAVRGSALAARRALAAHPWLRPAIETRTRRTPAVLGHMEAITSQFLAGGLSPDLTHHAMHALGNRIWGFSPELFNAPADRVQRPTRGASPDPEDYPGIRAVAAEARRRRPEATSCDEDFEFRFALELLLEAVARLHADGWSSPA